MDTRGSGYTEGTRVLSFTDRREAENHLHEQGFMYVEAPGRWRKMTDDGIVRADIHITQHGVLAVIYLQPRSAPMTEVH